MKNKMIITSIIYAMISCTHITFPMDDPSQPSKKTSSAIQSPRRASLPLIVYCKVNDQMFKPLYDIPNTGLITLQADYADYQGYIKKKEDGNYEIYRTSTKTPLKTVAFRTISPESFNTLKTTINEHKGDVYIQPISKSNTFLKLNKESLPAEKLSVPIFTQGQAAKFPLGNTQAAIGYDDAEDILRQHYQKEDNDHARQWAEKKQKDAQDQFSRSSSSDELPLRKGSSSHLGLPKQPADKLIDTPESIRSRHNSPTQSSSGTQSSPDSHTNSSTSDSSDTSPISTPSHPTSPEGSSAKLPTNAFSNEAVTDALKALDLSGEIIDDEGDDFLAKRIPSTTLQKLEEAEEILGQNGDMIEKTLTPIVGSTGAQIMVTGAEVALDIAQDLLAGNIVTGRPLGTVIKDFAHLPCYNIIAITENNGVHSITFTDQKDVTKTISVVLLSSRKAITISHIAIEDNDGNPAYLLKYVETTNKSEPKLNPKKDPLPAPYYTQYPGRVLAGSMGILAAFIMVAYHYDHLPESIMGMLDQLKDLISKNLPFTQSL